MDEQTNQKFVMVVDSIGRQFLGKLVSQTNETVVLEGHCKYFEQVTQQGSKNAVSSQLQPPSLFYMVDRITIKWNAIEEVSDKKLLTEYENMWIQLRAARANLSLSASMPTPSLRAPR